MPAGFIDGNPSSRELYSKLTPDSEQLRLTALLSFVLGITHKSDTKNGTDKQTQQRTAGPWDSALGHSPCIGNGTVSYWEEL